MNDYWKKEVLIASTLVEVLIVMIISGIIFLSVFEGVGMIRKVTSRMIVRLNSHCGLQEKYFELDGLFRECDSILNQNERLDFYRKGIIHETIGYRDSLLVLTRGEFIDTLFKRVNGWRLVRNGECRGRLSCVVVTGEERTCRTSFHDRGPGWKQGDRMYSRT